MERPKNREHGDYATNVALRLAKPAGRPAARGGRAARRGAARAADGIAAGRRRRPRLPQHHPRRRARSGQIAVQAVTGGRRLRAHRRPGRAAAEPRVRLGQPDRPGAHRRHPVGRRRRRARPAARGQRRRRHPRVLPQRRRARRSTGSRAACRPPRTAGRCPRTATPGSYIDDIAAQVLAAEPGAARPARRRAAARSSAARGVELMVAEIRSVARRRFGVHFDVFFSETHAARDRCPGEGGRAAARAGPRLRAPTARSGCGRRTSATTRTASWSRPTASRPTSPPTAPTTWTSGSAASTRS